MANISSYSRTLNTVYIHKYEDEAFLVFMDIYIIFFVSTAQQVRGVSAVNGSGFREILRERYGDIYIYIYTIIIIITGTYGIESAL